MKEHRRSTGTFWAAVVAAVALHASALEAANPEHAVPELHPNLARGRSDTQVLGGDGSMAIDHFNGNLTLSVPLGIEYPIDGTWSYRFALHYNSNVWDFRQVAGQARALPIHAANAGLGFDLSFGRLLPPGSTANPTSMWIWVSPDGGAHLMRSQIHRGVADIDDPTNIVHYSRDGSRIRLEVVGPDEARIDLPDGRMLFLAPASPDTWLPTRMEHVASDGWVQIDYAADGSAWQITDSIGRQHTVYLEADPTGSYPRLISRLDLAAIAGSIATYELQYETATLPRHCADQRGGSESLPLLSSWRDPMGETRTFTYHGAGSTCPARGRMASFQHVAGGTHAFSYGDYPFPSVACSSDVASFLTNNGGVVARSTRLPNDTVIGTWTMTPAARTADGSIATSACSATWRTTSLQTPSGDRHDYHFSTAPNDQATGLASEYGLPMTRAQADATGAFLSHEVFDCDANGGSCQPARATYQVWEASWRCADLSGDCFDHNRRLIRQRTVFPDDPLPNGDERFTQLVYSDYDGLGHHRTTTQTANFNGDEHWETTVEYNPEAGSLPGSFVPPSRNAPWFLERWTETRKRQGPLQLPTVEHACVLANGRVTRIRTLAGSTPGPDDVIVALTWQDGNVVERSWHGGDVQAVPTSSDLCGLSLPSPQYRTRYNFEHGVLAAAYDLDPAGQEVPGRVIDRTIDRNTGLTLQERDIAGVITDFGYDKLGRRTQERPEAGHGPWKYIWYRPPIEGSSWSRGPVVREQWAANGTSSPILRRQYQWFDFFGRPVAEQLDLPNEGRSRRLRRYDAEGHVLWHYRRYDPQAGAPPQTRYEDHDPFGRPRRIVSADGHVETITYFGTRETRKTISNGASFANETCFEQSGTLTEIRDARGRVRLQRDERPWPAPGHVAETEYAYDNAGRITGTERRTTIGQTLRRTSTAKRWDRRGFLELDSSADHRGVVELKREHGAFDARGLPTWQRYIDRTRPYPGLETALAYDPAGRLVQVADASDPTTLWKTFTYGVDNATDDRRMGRLVQAERYNYHPTRHLVVRDTYFYGGPAGQVSEKVLDVRRNGASIKRYRTATAYDALALPATVSYPVCEVCAPGEPTLARTVTVSREMGFASAVAGTIEGSAEPWIDSIEWGPGLSPGAVHHANGIADIYHADADRIPRTGRIEVLGASSLYDSGTYTYDGRGDVCGVGTKSRVASWAEPTAVDPPSNTCLDASLSDPFGGISGEVSDGSCRGSALDPVYVYDAQDRQVGQYDFSAKKRVQVAGTGWTWIQDPDNWTETWYLTSTAGTPLRVVEDGYANTGWRETTDTIRGVGTIAKAIHAGGSSPSTLVYHLHPAPGLTTSQAGEPMP